MQRRSLISCSCQLRLTIRIHPRPILRCTGTLPARERNTAHQSSISLALLALTSSVLPYAQHVSSVWWFLFFAGKVAIFLEYCECKCFLRYFPWALVLASFAGNQPQLFWTLPSRFFLLLNPLSVSARRVFAAADACLKRKTLPVFCPRKFSAVFLLCISGYAP